MLHAAQSILQALNFTAKETPLHDLQTPFFGSIWVPFELNTTQ